MITGMSFSPDERFESGLSIGGLKRINLLYGPNGSGKSTALRLISELGGENARLTKMTLTGEHVQAVVQSAAQVLEGKSGLDTEHSTASEIVADKQSITVPGKRRPEIHLIDPPTERFVEQVRSIADGLTDKEIEDIAHNWSASCTIAFQGSSIASQLFSSAYPISAPSERSASIEPNSLVGLIKNIQDGMDNRALVELSSLLARHLQIFEGRRLEVARLDGKEQGLVLHEQRTGEKFAVRDLGSGLQQIIHLLAPITLKALLDEKPFERLFLFDEPHVHMHPTLFRSFLSYLDHLSRERDLQVVLSTHSPVALESLQDDWSVFEFSQRDPLRPGGCSVRNLSGAFQSMKTSLDLAGREAFRSLIGHLLFGGYIVLVEGPSDEIVFRHIVDTLKLDGIQVAHTNGDSETAETVKKLRYHWPDRIVGIVDLNKKQKIPDDQPVISHGEKGIEEFYNKKVVKKKIQTALCAVRSTGGYSIERRSELEAVVLNALKRTSYPGPFARAN